MKKIEIILRHPQNVDYQDLLKLISGEFEVEMEWHKSPIPIRTALKKFGADQDGVEKVVGYVPNPEPFQIYLVIHSEQE